MGRKKDKKEQQGKKRLLRRLALPLAIAGVFAWRNKKTNENLRAG